MPTEFVRIRDTKNNTEHSVPRRRAEHLVERGGVEILDKAEAADKLGRPLPSTQPTTTSSKSGKESTR